MSSYYQGSGEAEGRKPKKYIIKEILSGKLGKREELSMRY